MSARHWSDGWTRDNLIDEIETLSSKVDEQADEIARLRGERDDWKQTAENGAKMADAEIARLQFLLANLNGYADLIEDAAKHMPKEFDAGLLRGLADRLRELKHDRSAEGAGQA